MINDYYITFSIKTKEDLATMDKKIFHVLTENELHGLIHATQRLEVTFLMSLLSSLIATVIAILNNSVNPFPEYHSIINSLSLLFVSIGFFLSRVYYETDKKMKDFMKEV